MIQKMSWPELLYNVLGDDPALRKKLDKQLKPNQKVGARQPRFKSIRFFANFSELEHWMLYSGDGDNNSDDPIDGVAIVTFGAPKDPNGIIHEMRWIAEAGK